MNGARTGRRVVVAVVLVAAMALVAVQAAKVDKAIIVVKNKPTSNGEVVFKLTPDSGEAKEIKIGIVEKMKADEVARDIAKEMTLALGEAYKIKVKGSNEVAIQPVNKTTTFDLVISSQTATGLSITIK